MISTSNSPRFREAGCSTQALGFRFADHRMTRAHPHDGASTVARTSSSRNIRYNRVANLRATATLADAAILRAAPRWR